MNDDAYDHLTKLLTELQTELGRRQWTENVYDRIDQASDFRGQLWDAIAAYRDHWSR